MTGQLSLYIWRRLLQSLITLFGATVVAFALVSVIPGDPARVILGEFATQTQVEQVRKQLELDQPLYQQYLWFLADLLRGELQSTQYHRPVRTLILERFPATAELAIASMFLAGSIACMAGIISAMKRNSGTDYLVSVLSLFGIAMPDFWFAIMLILFFGVMLKLLPVFGYPDLSFTASLIHLFTTGNSIPLFLFLQYITLPALAMGLRMAGILTRLLRSSLLEEIQKDYVRTARAKGLRNDIVLTKHVLKNSLLPTVTMFTMEFAKLLGGAVIIETVFVWPGVGKLVVDAVYARDFAIVQAAVVFFALIFIISNFLVDILYTYIDPRIKYG